MEGKLYRKTSSEKPSEARNSCYIVMEIEVVDSDSEIRFARSHVVPAAKPAGQ